MNPKHRALWGEILWISIQTRRWNGAPRNVTFCCCSEDTWHFIAIWSYYKKCSVPLPPNFVKQDGLQGLLSILWGYITLFCPQLSPGTDVSSYQALLPLLEQANHAWQTPYSIYSISSTSQPSTVHLAPCIIHTAQKFLWSTNDGS